ncbi:MAG: hypothetical protein QOF51_288 [Chloroflexota bacterium]|jgi:hypothetical protein|nr:hypothetical protein [Chloroflexota bacterium]
MRERSVATDDRPTPKSSTVAIMRGRRHLADGTASPISRPAPDGQPRSFYMIDARLGAAHVLAELVNGEPSVLEFHDGRQLRGRFSSVWETRGLGAATIYFWPS